MKIAYHSTPILGLIALVGTLSIFGKFFFKLAEPAAESGTESGTEGSEHPPGCQGSQTRQNYYNRKGREFRDALQERVEAGELTLGDGAIICQDPMGGLVFPTRVTVTVATTSKGYRAPGYYVAYLETEGPRFSRGENLGPHFCIRWSSLYLPTGGENEDQ